MSLTHMWGQLKAVMCTNVICTNIIKRELEIFQQWLTQYSSYTVHHFIMKDIPNHSYAWTAPQATINATWTSSLYYNPISHWNQFYHCCLTLIPYCKRHYFVLAPAQTLHDNLLAWAARTATGWTFSWLLMQIVVKAKVKTKD